MQAKKKRTSSIGCAIVYEVQENEDLRCVGVATTDKELAELLLVIPEDTYYAVHVLANKAVAGNGTYVRWGNEWCIDEHGAARGVCNVVTAGTAFEVKDMLTARRREHPSQGKS